MTVDLWGGVVLIGTLALVVWSAVWGLPGPLRELLDGDDDSVPN